MEGGDAGEIDAAAFGAERAGAPRVVLTVHRRAVVGVEAGAELDGVAADSVAAGAVGQEKAVGLAGGRGRASEFAAGTEAELECDREPGESAMSNLCSKVSGEAASSRMVTGVVRIFSSRGQCGKAILR